MFRGETRSVVEKARMRRHWLILLSVLLFVLFLTGRTQAQCPEDWNDLGICDTIYFETFGCDYIYQAEPGSFDSVRVAIYVTHDSNTFWWESEQEWVQDSISAFVMTMGFWHEPEGCADSVILPKYDNWNNIVMDSTDPRMSRSIFRDLSEEHDDDTVHNRMKWLASQSQGLEWSTVILDVYNDVPADSGYFWLSMIPSAPTNRRWWEGSRVLLATLTFLVSMSQDCDTTEIGLDTVFSPVGYGLLLTRHDAVVYYPRHLLPVKDTIYTASSVLCGDCSGDRVVDVADVIYLMSYLFLGASPPCPSCMGDANCNGEVHIEDVIYLINYLFLGGSPPCPECCCL